MSRHLPREVNVAGRRVRLHPPVLAYRGRGQEHVTRPNLCHLGGGAVGLIVQQALDYNDVVQDARLVFVSTDDGASWTEYARDLDVGSFSLYSDPVDGATVMPYDSLKFGAEPSVITGPRVGLTWEDRNLVVGRDRTAARFPRPLMTFRQGDVGEDFENHPPLDKPITSLWGTIRALPDGTWVAPAYGCYADDPRSPLDNPLVCLRRMARFTSDLMTSADRGRSWYWLGTVARAPDIPAECTEGAAEVHLLRYPGRWRAVFRTGAIRPLTPMRYCESTDGGRTWSHPRVLEGVAETMDPRGLVLDDLGLTLLATGRRGFELYVAKVDSLDFRPLGMIAHHNAFHGTTSRITATYQIPSGATCRRSRPTPRVTRTCCGSGRRASSSATTTRPTGGGSRTNSRATRRAGSLAGTRSTRCASTSRRERSAEVDQWHS